MIRLLLPMLLLAACDPAKQDTGDPNADPSGETPTFVDEPTRLVAIGDLHGDLDAARAALTLAGAIDANDSWVGGDLVVVQTGDQIDRGDQDREVLDLMDRLATEAREAGGALYPLCGNHEIMNVEGDLRYASDASLAAFADIPYDPDDPALEDLDEEERGRAAAFLPGGPYALMLATRNLVMKVGDLVLLHGGLTPEHVELGLYSMNAQARAWMRGEAEEPEFLADSDASPVWVRDYSDGPDEEDCNTLSRVLDQLGASAMVVGHTVQDQINAACDGKVWRIDVGMSAYYGDGVPAVLQVQDGEFTVLEGEASTE